jgi:hypothetical protein
MPAFLKRYLAGDCVAVWRELVGLGEDVRQKRHYADAAAVAAETMRRARHNVEVLIGRLDAMGYRFMKMEEHDACAKDATKRAVRLIAELSEKMDPADKRRFDRPRIMRSPEFRALLAERAEQSRQAAIQYIDTAFDRRNPPLKDPEVFAPPDKQTAKDLDKLEKLAGGPLPLSLRAWYEQVGGVSLLGWHSTLDPNQDEPNYGVCPDPLMIEPLKPVIQHFKEGDYEGELYVDLAPDDVFKTGGGGCGPYGMRVPDARADGIFTVVGIRKGPTFVNYLRKTFEWGGFPGWEGRRGCPRKTIAQLAEGLISL